MSTSQGIESGTPVYGSDDQLVGSVINVHGDVAMGTVEIDCGGELCRVPTTAIKRVAAGGLYLPNPAAQYRTQPHAREMRADRPDSAEAVPLPPNVDDLPGHSPLELPR